MPTAAARCWARPTRQGRPSSRPRCMWRRSTDTSRWWRGCCAPAPTPTSPTRRRARHPTACNPTRPGCNPRVQAVTVCTQAATPCTQAATPCIQASTALHRAVAEGDGAAPCVRALLAGGAAATVADGSGKSSCSNYRALRPVHRLQLDAPRLQPRACRQERTARGRRARRGRVRGGAAARRCRRGGGGGGRAAAAAPGGGLGPPRCGRHATGWRRAVRRDGGRRAGAAAPGGGQRRAARAL